MRTCLGVNCGNEAGSLKCPTCQKNGQESYFCSQACFKSNWVVHKKLHSQSNAGNGTYNPFPSFPYTGSLRPVYPLSRRREVPARIPHPDYAATGDPVSERKTGRNKVKVLGEKEQEGMRKACRIGREVLDIAARAIRPGVTTDAIDEILHNACVERDAYPSPLNYKGFPKSVCTSPNEVICHGIPDQRILADGDILNIDVSVYHGGFHGDLNETYYVGRKAAADAESVRVVETARECLARAIDIVKPGMLFQDPGNVIEACAKARGCSVVKSYCGHGINQLFHCAPVVPHYARNKAVGRARPGVCFTIEPMVCLGSHRDDTWPDNWTSTTRDGSRTAQFEHTLLVTEDGVEVLTARLPDSPGGPIQLPTEEEPLETKPASKDAAEQSTDVNE